MRDELRVALLQHLCAGSAAAGERGPLGLERRQRSAAAGLAPGQAAAGGPLEARPPQSSGAARCAICLRCPWPRRQSRTDPARAAAGEHGQGGGVLAVQVRGHAVHELIPLLHRTRGGWAVCGAGKVGCSAGLTLSTGLAACGLALHAGALLCACMPWGRPTNLHDGHVRARQRVCAQCGRSQGPLALHSLRRRPGPAARARGLAQAAQQRPARSTGAMFRPPPNSTGRRRTHQTRRRSPASAARPPSCPW